MFKMTDDKSCILDPLTCLCKIALLHFMPDKTRLSISNYVLTIQEYHYYQWIERMKNGDIRLDISNLNSSLLKCLKWYVLDGPERLVLDKKTLDAIQVIAQYAIKGFIKLQTGVYRDHQPVRIIIQYFINMIHDALDGVWDETRYINHDSRGSLSERIKVGIDPLVIQSIGEMLINASKMEYGNVNAIVDCVHQILINRDTEFVKMMREVNTLI